jgi:hypothetical protein
VVKPPRFMTQSYHESNADIIRRFAPFVCAISDGGRGGRSQMRSDQAIGTSASHRCFDDTIASAAMGLRVLGNDPLVRCSSPASASWSPLSLVMKWSCVSICGSYTRCGKE